MNDGNAKQQITDRIKNVTNILVTVSTNPTVDELSAALGLTLMLNKLDKHATAVFSGEVPSAISFLDPTKTFENTVDSLRDFIIALDKEKADRLRYRVEDDVVRIFITPYRTRITEDDLEFTHGDFNVELVLALGVENKEVLDQAIAAHGRILHDATVATLNAQNKTSNLGSIDWQDTNASSLCEMLVSVAESLQVELDEQIATALLTGIVAATNRFSNTQTSPKSMTMAAQLMAAGANQQLIAAKLEEGAEISSNNEVEQEENDGSTKLDEGASKKIRDKKNKKKSESPKKDDGSLGEMTISHDDQSDQPKAPSKEPEGATIEEHDQRNKQASGEAALDEALAKLNSATPPPTPTLSELEKDINKASPKETIPTPAHEATEQSAKSWKDQPLSEPSMGGTLSATADEAREEKMREEESNRNKVIMSHDRPPASSKGKTIAPPAPTLPTPALQSAQTTSSPAATLAQIEADMHKQAVAPPPSAEPVGTPEQQVSNILNDPSLEAPTPVPTIPKTPPQASTGVTPPPPPPLPDFSTLPPLPSASATPPTVPPLDANGLPLSVPSPLSPTPPPSTTSPQAASPAPTPSAPEPGQFRIPGQ